MFEHAMAEGFSITLVAKRGRLWYFVRGATCGTVLITNQFSIRKARCKTSVAGIDSRTGAKTGHHHNRTVRAGSHSDIVVHRFGGESECAWESPCPACAALARRHN